MLAHELTHAVTERTAGLVYQGQPGALNESVSDVFAACSEQRLLGQSAAEADWLIGAELFLPGVAAPRRCATWPRPGTAYDDPRLGKDPQPAHLDDYVETTDDNGGVHINSGIPNRAFQLAAVAIGGSSWAGAGRIWYDALTGGDVRPDTDFAGFAAATVAAAGDARGRGRGGVAPGRGTPGRRQLGARDGRRRPAGARCAPSASAARGASLGRTVEAEVDLGGADERAATLAGLVGPHRPAGRPPGRAARCPTTSPTSSTSTAGRCGCPSRT